MNIPLITTHPTDQEPLRETREALRAFLKSFQGEPEAVPESFEKRMERETGVKSQGEI